jgi:hypothetical protein
MNKSKIIAATGLATVMSASAATADGVSLNGYMEGWFTTGDNTTGMSNTVFSSSVYVAYSSTLDNGMGLSAGFTLTPGSQSTGFAVDTGMGTLRTGSGYQMNSAADGMDSMPANANAQYSALKSGFGGYNDGDANSGEGIKYTSPSMNGWTIAASIGENVCTTTSASTVNTSDSGSATDAVTTTSTTTCSDDRVTSVAASGSVMGVSVAAGAVDQAGSDGDDSFMTLGYSVGGVNLGYGSYDSDDDEVSVYSVTTSVAGMTVGYRFDDLDAATAANDNDLSTYSVGKDMGGMSLTLMYEDQDAADNSEWNLVYAIGF